MDEVIQLTGKVVHIVFRNDDTFYTVMKFKLADETEKTITAVGLIPSIETDIIYRISGHYTEHPRYGLQFAIETIQRPLPDEEEGIVRFLSGIQFPGIGKRTAEKVVRSIGEHCLELIKENPEILRTVPDLSENQIQIITDGMKQSDDGMEQLVQFLNVHGIGMRNLVRLNRAYGNEALVRLKENPYRVIDECDGFGFKTADKIAMSLGFSEDDERRLYAYLVSLCMDICMSTGDSYTDATMLEERFKKDTAGVDCDYDLLFQQALMNRRLVQEGNRIYPVTQYDAEEAISSILARFPDDPLEPIDDDILQNYLDELQNRVQITYDEHQVEAIKSFFVNPFLIITGGPGTGKTTVVRALTELFKLVYPGSTILCAAPTGRAAKRLAELTDTAAYTIHSLLKWDLETNSFGVTKEEPLQGDLLIVDEFSMVDSWLFSNLLLASRNIRKICVIGDEDQLPSVSPGCVLRDLIDSRCFPLIRLSHIYRQKEGSDVIQLAHQIRNGSVNFSKLEHDVRFFECNPADIKNSVLNIVQSAVDKGYEMNDIQVLSPMYNGAGGIDILNNALQECLNPLSRHKKQYRFGYQIFREGDKILQLKNQTDDDVYNGDIGILTEIEDPDQSETHQTTLCVMFEDTPVYYTPDNLMNITLAYCISIHKSQGSEYPIVIMPIISSQWFMLQRKLIYTGVTRARQSLILLGEKDAFNRGIETLERHSRSTTLTRRLKACIPNLTTKNPMPEAPDESESVSQ